MPQFYLRQWSDSDGKLWRYKREPSGKVSEMPVTPKGTGFQKHLYTMRSIAPFFPERTPDAIESKFFSPLDDASSKVFQKLVSGHGLPLLDEERTTLALFLNSLLERDPRVLHARDEIAPAVAEKVLAGLRARCQNEQSHARLDEIIRHVDYAAIARNTVREHMVNEIRDKDVVDYFKALSWTIVNLRPAIELITSDSPLVINGGGSKRPISMITLPLSPSKLFMMCPKNWKIEGEFLEALVVGHNLSLVEGDGDYLYSSTRLEDGPIVRLRLAVEMRFGRGSFGDASETNE